MHIPPLLVAETTFRTRPYVFLMFLAALVLCPAQAAAQSKKSSDQPWPMAALNHQNTRYSELAQITTSNVKDLKQVWNFETGVKRGHEAAPVIANDTMYLVTPFPNYLYAFDLKNNFKVKWKYDPKPAPFSQGVACCDVVNRGCAFEDGKIFYNTLDCHVVAV